MKYKKLFILTLIVIFAVGMAGCMSNNKNMPEKMKETVLAYLNEEYTDTFEVKNYTSENWAYEYRSMTVYSSKYADTFNVKIYEDNEGFKFKDDYFKLTMKEDANIFFADIIEKYNQEGKTIVRFSSPALPESLDNSATFIDYVKTGKANLDIYFLSDKDFEENDVNSILVEIRDYKIICNVYFVVIENMSLLEEYSMDEIFSAKREKIVKESYYFIDNEYKIVG